MSLEPLIGLLGLDSSLCAGAPSNECVPDAQVVIEEFLVDPVPTPVVGGAVVPNQECAAHGVADPRFVDQWALCNSGRVRGHSSLPDADTNAPDAWDRLQGEGVRPLVMVIDQGVDREHGDLSEVVWKNEQECVAGNCAADDCDGRDQNGFVDDVFGLDALSVQCNQLQPAGCESTRPACSQSSETRPYCRGRGGHTLEAGEHGTQVASLIGAAHLNEFGMRGISSRVRIVPCVAFVGSSGRGTIFEVLSCLHYALALRAKKLPLIAINMSFLLRADPECGGDKVAELLAQAFRRLGDEGVLLVAAAGSDGLNLDEEPLGAIPTIPSDNLIVAGASDRFDGYVPGTSFGSRTVHLLAPSDPLVFAAYPSRTSGHDPFGEVQTSTTSWGTAHVTGAVAEVWAGIAEDCADVSECQKLRWFEARNRILAGVSPSPAERDQKKSISGGRLRLIDDDGGGAVECVGRKLRRWLRPRSGHAEVSKLEPIQLTAISIECQSPMGSSGEPNDRLKVHPCPGSAWFEPFVLLDDGKGSDQFAGDGYYSNSRIGHQLGIGTFSLCLDPQMDPVTVIVSEV